MGVLPWGQAQVEVMVVLSKAGGYVVQGGLRGWREEPFVGHCRGMSKGCSHPWVPSVLWGESTTKMHPDGCLCLLWKRPWGSPRLDFSGF